MNRAEKSTQTTKIVKDKQCERKSGIVGKFIPKNNYVEILNSIINYIAIKLISYKDKYFWLMVLP